MQKGRLFGWFSTNISSYFILKEFFHFFDGALKRSPSGTPEIHIERSRSFEYQENFKMAIGQ